MLTFDEAINLIEELLPYLINESKKKRSNLLLDKYERVPPSNGRYSTEMLELKNAFYNEFIAIK